MHTFLRKLWLTGAALGLVLFLWTPQVFSQAGSTTALSADNPANLFSNGGFEMMRPAYWEQSGDGAVWTRERSRTPEWSLKLEGSGEALWTQPEAVRNWVPGIPGGGNPEVEVGLWVYMEGVNTDPGSDDEKFQAVFEFFEDASQTTNVLGEPIVLDLPQDAASTDGWVEVNSSSLGAITFPGEQAAKSATITIRKGANATGAAYADDIFMRKVDPAADGWAGGYFNTNVDQGATWYYWWSGFESGSEGWPEDQPHIVTVTDAAAFEGDYSLRLETGPFDPSTETVGISERVAVDGPVIVSFKVKHSGNTDADSIGIGQNNLGLTVLWYNNLEAGAAGFGEIGGVDLVLDGQFSNQLIPLLTLEEDEWTQYAFALYPPDETVGMEVRPRYWHGFSGVSYWDDFFAAHLSDITSMLDGMNLLSNGGFEMMKPAYWESSGDGATWSREQARTPEWSLALGGSGEATWTQPEAVRNWVPGIPGGGNPEVELGLWVYTDGVNTAPASDDEKFQAVFEFFEDASQTTNVLGEPIVLDLPQDEAGTGGWVDVNSSSLGAITFPGEQAAKSARITIRKGANASGSVYVDDVYLRKVDPAADGWAGGYFNTNVDQGATWYYWWSGFESGADNWPEEQPHIVTVTDADTYEGDYSLRLETGPFDPSAETVAISDRVPVTPGVPYLMTFMVKHEGNADEDSIGVGQNNLGLTTLWYNNLEGGAAGYGEIGGVDVILNGEFNPMFIPLLENSAAGKGAEADWTQYGFVFYPPAEAVGTETRPRYWHGFSGVTYWDEVKIIPLDGLSVGTAAEEDIVGGSVPNSFRLHQNYPNPFNPATTIAFDLSKQSEVSLRVINVLGQVVDELIVDEMLPAGTQRVQFSASNLPSGLYIYMLEIDGQEVEARKMVLLK